MRVLVTGATGFIGTSLCKKLLNDKHDVIGIDNFYCSRPTQIKEFESFERFTFIEHDIIDPITFLENRKPDYICNLACPASPVQYMKDPVYTTKTSVMGILNMLDLATQYQIPMLHASTSEVYGDPLEHPQQEHHWGNVNPIGIRSCYDEGKRLAESLCFDYNRKHGTQIKVIRIFNTYGPFMAPDDGRVVSNFIMNALKGAPLMVYGEGKQTRSFCYVDDLVEGIMKFLFLEDKEVIGPINLGNPHEIAINELAQYVDKFIPNTKIVFQPLPEDDPQQRKPNISLAQKILKWQPTIDLEQGLAQTIAWFKLHHAS